MADTSGPHPPGNPALQGRHGGPVSALPPEAVEKITTWSKQEAGAARWLLLDSGWSAEEVARLDAITAQVGGQVDTVPLVHQLAKRLTGERVPREESLTWVRVMLSAQPNTLFVAGAPRWTREAVEYEEAAGGDRGLARAAWAARIPVEELAEQVAAGPVDVRGLWLIAGLTVEP